MTPSRCTTSPSSSRAADASAPSRPYCESPTAPATTSTPSRRSSWPSGPGSSPPSTSASCAWPAPGYASLHYLATLPITSLKVDSSFTAGLPDDPTCVTIMSATVGLAADLGMGCVVEGVETKEQLNALPASARLLVQGYLYARPEAPQSELPTHLTRPGDAPTEEPPAHLKMINQDTKSLAGPRFAA